MKAFRSVFVFVLISGMTCGWIGIANAQTAAKKKAPAKAAPKAPEPTGPSTLDGVYTND